MPLRLVSVGDDFKLPAAVKVEDPNLPARLGAGELSATYALKGEAGGADPGAAVSDPLRWFRTQLGNVSAAPVDVLVVGDSTAEGARAATRSDRWVDQFVAKLRARHQPAGVAGGVGYTPAVYSGGIPFSGATWTYKDGAVASTLLADSYDGATGELNGRTTPTGGYAYAVTTGIYSLSGGNAVSATEAAGIIYMNTVPSVDREIAINFKIGTLSATNQAVRIFGMSDGTTDRVYLESTVNAAATPTSTWRLGKRLGGVNTDVVTWTPTGLATPSGAEVTVAFRVEGLTVTCTVNGDVKTMTLTQAEKDTIVGNQIAIQNPGVGSQIHDISMTTLAESETTVFPTQGTTNGLGLRCLNLGSTGVVDRAETTFTGTAVDVIVTKKSGGGVLTVDVDGVITTINTANATEVVGVTHRVGGLTAGAHTLKLSSTGTVLFEGIMVYNGDETKGIRLWEAAHVGYNTVSFTANTKWADSADALMTPDLAFIALGLNDFKAQTITPAIFKTNLQTIITKVRQANPDVSIVLHNSWERGDVASPTYPWADYLKAIDEVVAEDGSILLVDLNARLLGWNKVPASYRNVWDVDTIHLSLIGYNVVAKAVTDTVDRM